MTNAIRSIGVELDLSADAWGELEDSSSLLGDAEALRLKMSEEGYLFIRNFFPRELIQKARLALLNAVTEPGLFVGPLEEGKLAPGAGPRLAIDSKEVRENEAVRRVIFGPEIKSFYETFLGGTIRHFDYVWSRMMGTGAGTLPHCDIVYMGRGTKQLYTAWIPYGDVTYDIGGLMLLERSIRHSSRIQNYLESDVDTYCENIPNRDGWKFGGALSNNPVSLRQKLGGRWLSAEYRMGDLLTFPMNTIHASIDNQSNRVRISTDTRYQLASEPVDERWIGEDPIAHGPNSKRGLIC